MHKQTFVGLFATTVRLLLFIILYSPKQSYTTLFESVGG